MVTLKTKGSSIVLFNDVVSQEKGGSITNASFEVKFDVDFPYAESNDYVLDITLGFYDETYDDGSSGPYVTETLVCILIINGQTLHRHKLFIVTLFLELDTILLKKSIGIVKILSKIFLLIRMECLLIM